MSRHPRNVCAPAYENMDLDWYVEPPTVAQQIFDTISFGPKENRDLIWDCCVGGGTSLNVAKERGHPTIGSDLVDRGSKHEFFQSNILDVRKPPKMPGRSTSVLVNPPYSYEERICERIIRHVVQMNLRRAVFIVPITFLCAQERWEFFSREFNPSQILICSQRPTMPPGEKIHEMATPFSGGVADYMAVVYSGPRHRWQTEIKWMKPTTK